MMNAGDVVSYLEMCADFGVNLQRGMNFRLVPGQSLILMSLRPGAPYADGVEEGGKVIIYEGHNLPLTKGGPDPKTVDQPEFLPSGRLTQNGLFADAVRRFKASRAEPERVKVFEKIRAGIWVYNGVFRLVDVWQETSDRRQVFKFKLEILDQLRDLSAPSIFRIDHDRVIPAAVKIEVWKRDKGSCVKCGSKENLHFDHVIPYSQGGSSKDAKNIQILCLRHNLDKRDRIE
ncbi:MAG: endonuclease [Candidatus Sulfotelmatobacter sp.]|nr:endonuclease [Candidatus Sulfotelmatobacter sp.]